MPGCFDPPRMNCGSVHRSGRCLCFSGWLRYLGRWLWCAYFGLHCMGMGLFGLAFSRRFFRIEIPRVELEPCVRFAGKYVAMMGWGLWARGCAGGGWRTCDGYTTLLSWFGRVGRYVTIRVIT